VSGPCTPHDECCRHPGWSMTGPIGVLLGAIRPQRAQERSHGTDAPAAARWANTPDGPLLSQIGAGDVNALAQLYDRHATFCWAIARRLTADETLAAFAVEDAFLNVWRNPPMRSADRLGSQLAELTRDSLARRANTYLSTTPADESTPAAEVQTRCGFMPSKRSTLVRLPAGESNFQIDKTQPAGTLSEELPQKHLGAPDPG
jgi:hypothetical protein